MMTLEENVFDEMHETWIEPDVTSFSVVLHVYSRANKSELTFDKLSLMKGKGKGICWIMAWCTLLARCLCGRIEDAEELLGEMVRNGVSPCAGTNPFFFV
ncbi:PENTATRICOPEPTIDE REPEAT-CONTAINING PROTEIN [Salix viminalis]|uniref:PENTATRICOPEPTIDE REPEAT-CONTAINING PROTEIN n=1 Tax=Salix viminalis TaxID=40686 RepID=A0A9Q0SI57_SALVM|nr:PENTATRICOPEPTIDE REPEAT-CONTAINING PROTEIN [Salix viminalis]